MQELQQPLQRRDRGGSCVLVAVVEAPLHGLGIPVAEIVEGEVVELVHHVREVELSEESLHLTLCLREAGENPALLERAGTFLRRGTLGGLQNQPCNIPELVRELSSLLDRALREADVL